MNQNSATTKFRKKRVVIDAWHLSGPAVDREVYDLIVKERGADDGFVSLRAANGGLIIETLEGAMTARRGDWIIRGVQGEFYPCKPDIFEATYESADSPPSGVSV